MSTEIVRGPGAIATRQSASAIELIALETEVIKTRHLAVQKLVEEVFIREVHFGPPFFGADEDDFLKPGIELAASLFSLALQYVIQPQEMPDGVRYLVTCNVLHQATGTFMGSGIGGCSTAETRYQWRKATKAQFEHTPADRRREKVEKDGKVTLQVREEVEDKLNTALKMAAVRAARDGVQSVLGIRGMIRFPSGQAQQQGKSRDRRQPEPAAPAIATAEQVAELLATGQRKGWDEARIRRSLSRNAHFDLELAKLPVALWEWSMAGLAELPDVDPETGEVLPGQADDVPFGDEETPAEKAFLDETKQGGEPL